MTPPRRSATVAMMRVIGLDSTGVSSVAWAAGQTARCWCGSELEFPIGSYGQTLERCTNRRCPDHELHAPAARREPLPPPPEPVRVRKGAKSTRRRRRNRQ